MKFLQQKFDDLKPLFEKGGKYEKFYTLYEGHRTIFFRPDIVTNKTGVQVRDAGDLKRMMMTVIIAMIPCLIFGMWNVGHQHFLATGVDATLLDKFLIGAMKVLPIVVVSYAVGLSTEFTFCVIRNHPVEEGFLVTGLLIPLVMPPTIPLWQVGLATVFAVIIGKEVFGGTGMNILNVALTARAFLYFAYPSQISGDVWTFLGDGQVVDGYSGATILAYGAEAAANGTDMATAVAGHWSAGMFDFFNMFMGAIPGFNVFDRGSHSGGYWSRKLEDYCICIWRSFSNGLITQWLCGKLFYGNACALPSCNRRTGFWCSFHGY